MIPTSVTRTITPRRGGAARLVAATVATFAAILMAAPAGGTESPPSIDAASAEASQLWLVQMSSPPTADGTSLSTVLQEQNAFRAEAKRAGIKVTERYAFGKLWNGLSVRTTASQVVALSRLSTVTAMYPAGIVSLPETTAVSEPELFSALTMTHADVVQDELGLDGSGVKVAVIDSGIDYDHPDLGGCFGPGCRVAYGYDFVGDDYNSSGTSSQLVPTPDPDPDDCNGHGTHVAGIIGASGEVTGVAPNVTFGAYRVFGCTGTTTTDVMLAAMERVLADRMQVLNMSIGSPFQWPQYPTAQAADRLVNKGVAVVAAIGNNGASGLYAASAPGVGKKVIGVASFDNLQATQPAFADTFDDRLFGYFPADGAPIPPTSGEYELLRTGNTNACSPLPAGSLAGAVALIRRGTCTFYAKAANASAAGATAAVIYNIAPGALSPNVEGTPAITIPVVGITAADGSLLNQRLDAGPVTIRWTADLVSPPVATAGGISSFSSYGMAPDLSLKPDIGAPGGFIWSTYPLELGGHANLSGTSMASPHVAGAVALLLEAAPNTSANAVGAILQNNAEPALWWGNPPLGYLDNVWRQGAGMLDIAAAVQATTRITPAKLSLGESEAGPVTSRLTISNSGPTEVTFDLSSVSSLSTGSNRWDPHFYSASNDVSFSQAGVPATTVSVPGGGATAVDVTISPDQMLPDGSLFGGWIVLTPQGGGQIERVPYAGFKGNYQALAVLTPTPYGFPWLAKSAGGYYYKQQTGASFTLAGDDLPYILLHLDHQSRLLRFEVKAVGGKSWQRALNWSYVPSNASATSYFAFAWDGKTTNGSKVQDVPNGTYTMKVVVQKALGTDADIETWTSPPITIARP